MSTSTTLNRLAGLPKIPKLKKKSATSPQKPKSVALPPPPPPPPPPAPLPPAPVVLPFPLNPSDDDTLSEPSSSSSSEDDDDVPLAKSVPPPRKNGQAVEDVCLVCHGSCRCGGAKGASVYVGGAVPLASTSTSKPVPAPKKASATPYDPKLKMKSSKPSTSSSSSHKPFTSTTYRPTSSTSAPRPPPPSYLPPLPSTYSASPSTSSKPRGRPRKDGSTPKPRSTAQTAADASYSPSTSVARPAAPQRMSLRQVLALSLQEAEQQTKSREGTPDANEIMNAARGRAGGNKKEGGGGGKEKLSDVSDFELDVEESSSSEEERGRMDVDGASEDEVGGMEKEEERLLREEIERRKRKKGKEAEALYDDSDEDDDDEDLLDAWDQNVRAMEQLRRRRSSGAGPGADASFEQDEDSDVAITEVPPGNGLGVVTWSDYDSFGTDDEEEEEDQLAEALAARQAHGDQALLADSFEDELEELFALSEAVVGPVRQDEYDAGDMWFEALSDFDGSSADDESGEGDDDIDAEMIFGEHGELKKLFGGRRNKRRHSAVESSAGESDSDDEQVTESEADLDVELVRVGIELSRADKGKGKEKEEEEEDGDDETASYHSEDEQTDSSCSDTDIYRYAPRTGALANLQAPTTADLASLNADSVLVDMNQLKKSASGSNSKSAGGASSSSSRPALASASAVSKQKGKGKSLLPVIREEGRIKRRAPTMGTFDASERKKADAATGGLTVVVVDDSDVPAPSPFRVAKKSSKRRMLDPTPSRRTRTGSHVSTTSATSGSVSLDPGSNVGSPVLANVKLEFDLDSMLQESVFEDEAEMFLATGGSSSETDAGDATATDAASSKPASALSDFSRWNRIPIGAFRSRTMRGTGGDAPSQVLTAKAAASERGKKKKKSTAGGVATSILRDHKAVATSLHHTLGSPGAAMTASKRAIRSRMLTSPVLAPVLPNLSSSHISPPRPGFTAAAAAAALASKKAKRSKKSTPAGSVRSKSPASRSHSRQPSVVASTSAAPTANLPPLHSPLFRTVSMTEPSLLHLE
ncbi:hypothetical protein JCM5296_006386 [Sporobolomyces johnsonii]